MKAAEGRYTEDILLSADDWNTAAEKCSYIPGWRSEIMISDPSTPYSVLP